MDLHKDLIYGLLKWGILCFATFATTMDVRGCTL